MRTLIQKGTVYDGTGSEGFAADVLVQDDKIEAVAPHIDAEVDTVIDAAGLTVAPGFIDTHRHCDTAALVDPDFGRIETAQGLTTIIGGNCGLAPLPVRPETARQISDYIEPCLGPTPDTMQMAHFSEYLDALDKTDKPLNTGSYVGIGTLRACVKLNLTNTRIGLMLVYLSFSVPYAVWMLVGFFKTVPIGIEEAARIDGANKLQVFIRIVLPLVSPGIVATAIYVFINAWNEYLYSMILMSSSDKTTISVAVKTLEGADILNWGSLMAACAIVVVPSIIFFCFIQNKMAGGLSDGAVK